MNTEEMANALGLDSICGGDVVPGDLCIYQRNSGEWCRIGYFRFPTLLPHSVRCFNPGCTAPAIPRCDDGIWRVYCPFHPEIQSAELTEGEAIRHYMKLTELTRGDA